MKKTTSDSHLRTLLDGPDIDKFSVSDAVELWGPLKIDIFFIVQ